MERTQHPKEERKLDKALEETFPGSDPVSISVPDKEKEWTPEELEEAEQRKRRSPGPSKTV